LIIFEIKDYMSIEVRKLNIISWVTELKDESILSKIEQLKPSPKDWWETISKEEQLEIEEGMDQADRNEFKSTDEVLEKYKKWVSK
jgi:hypothetical protein